ncbi:MAG: GNAT family N-acetyltransferase [Theionarchaea archaeon]|nr:GNAT family N-acetyltransferase [Theionarchaea archaeon]
MHHEIIELTENDAEDLEDVFEKTWSISCEYPPGWRRERQLSREEIVEEMRCGYHFFGAKDSNGKIMGVYKLSITDEGCFGEQQSILPEYSGRGLASAMYEQFIRYAQDHGYEKNYVNVLEHHTACIHLVEKYGFEKEGIIFEQAEGMRVQRYVRWCTE